MRSVIFTILLLLLGTELVAQTKKELTIEAVAGYSDTRNLYGGADISFAFRSDASSAIVNLEELSSKDLAIGISARPQWTLEKGRFFLDGTMHSRMFASYECYEFVYAGSAALDFRHFLVQAGLYSRMIADSNMKWHSLEQINSEPFNLLYRVSLKLKGDDAPWDLVATCSDFTEYEYERHWQPIFSLLGRYRIDEKLDLLAEGVLKPAGMFHLDASFYAAWLKLGLKYTF